jgi:hypothetical protein
MECVKTSFFKQFVPKLAMYRYGSCDGCSEPRPMGKECSGCRHARFCSKECLAKAWKSEMLCRTGKVVAPAHKTVCKAMAELAKEAGRDGWEPTLGKVCCAFCEFGPVTPELLARHSELSGHYDVNHQKTEMPDAQLQAAYTEVAAMIFSDGPNSQQLWEQLSESEHSQLLGLDMFLRRGPAPRRCPEGEDEDQHLAHMQASSRGPAEAMREAIFVVNKYQKETPIKIESKKPPVSHTSSID